MYAGVPHWGRFTPDPTQTVRIRTTDTRRSWLVTLGQVNGTEEDGTVHDEPGLDVAVVGTGERTAATVSGPRRRPRLLAGQSRARPLPRQPFRARIG